MKSKLKNSTDIKKDEIEENIKKNQIELKLVNFEGPIALLCYLVEKNKMEVTDIDLSKIAEQYLDIINKMKEYDMEIVSSFLIIASNLIYIKTKALLPKDKNDEIDEIEEELKQKIIEYKKYKENMPYFRERIEKGINRLTKREEIVFYDKIEYSEIRKPEELEQAYKKVLFSVYNRKNKQKENVNKLAVKEKFSVKKKLLEIFEKVSTRGKVLFSDLFLKEDKPKGEVIAGFLGTLELSLRNKIYIDQKNNFSEIILRKNNSNNIKNHEKHEKMEELWK